MSRRLLLLLGFTCACSPVGVADDSFGAGNFGEGTSGGASAGTTPTTDPEEDDDGSTSGMAETDGGDTDTDAGGSSTGEDGGFTFEPGLYVSAEGDDANDGSREAPMATIQAALLQAQAQGLQAVYVAAGSYDATHDQQAAIQLRAGISLYGGFNPADWEDRDPGTHITEIIDASVATTATELSPHRAVVAPAEVTQDDVLDGFTITAAGVAYAASVSIEGGSPTLSNNVLQGQATATSTAAVRITGGEPVFEHNVIDPVGATSSSTGVRCEDASPRFIGNDILSGETDGAHAVDYQGCGGSMAHNVIQAEAPPAGSTRAVELVSSSPDVLSNSISANPADGDTSYHLALSGTSAPRVANNNFVRASELGSVYCIYASSGAMPSTLTNNNLVGDYLYYGAIAATTLEELETSLPLAAQNVTVEAAVIDALAGDLRLRDDGSVPCALAQGGVSIASLVPEIDRDGTTRTEPWSIGAFELDGSCR